MSTTIRDAIKILRDARAIIEQRDRWTVWSSAKNKSGEPVSPLSPDAYAFDASGAIIRAEIDHFGDSTQSRLEENETKTPRDSLVLAYQACYEKVEHAAQVTDEMPPFARFEAYDIALMRFNDAADDHKEVVRLLSDAIDELSSRLDADENR